MSTNYSADKVHSITSSFAPYMSIRHHFQTWAQNYIFMWWSVLNIMPVNHITCRVILQQLTCCKQFCGCCIPWGQLIQPVCHVNSYAVTDPVEVAALPLAAGITFILYVWVLGIPNPVTFHLRPSAAICTFPSELPTKTLKCTSFQLLLWPQTEYVFVPQYLLKLKVHSHIHNSLQIFPIPS